MTFKYSTPASNKGGQEIEIDLEAMLFEFSPGLLTTVTNVVKGLIGQKEVCMVFCFIDGLALSKLKESNV